MAKLLEPAIWNEVVRVLTDPTIAKKVIEDAKRIHDSQGNTKEADRLRAKIQGIQEQIEALAEHLTKIPKGLSPAPIYSQMEKLEAMKLEAAREHEKLLASGAVQEMPAEYRDYEKYLELIRKVLPQIETMPELKQRILERLVHKIEVLPDGFRIHFYVGRSRFVQNEERGLGSHPSPSTLKKENPQAHDRLGVLPPMLFLNFPGSNSLTNGRGGGPNVK